MSVRFKVASLVVIAALLPALTASATPDARTSAVPKKCAGTKPTDPLLEVVKLPAGDREPVPVATRFKPGELYTVRICGTSNIRNAPTAGSTTVEDAFHAVSCTKPGGTRCEGSESWPLARAGVQASDRRDSSQFVRGSISWFAKGGGTNPAYRKDHSYTLRLNDLGPELVLRNAACCPGTYTLDGGYRVEIYGAPPKGFAARFSIDQRGEPAPPNDVDLAGTETIAGGFVYFSGVPAAGKQTKGTAVAMVSHVDEYLDPVTFAPATERVVVHVGRALYSKTAKARILGLKGLVISDTGVSQFNDAVTGETVDILVIDAFDDEDDTLSLKWRDPSGDVRGQHLYVHGPKNSLKLRVTPVKKR